MRKLLTFALVLSLSFLLATGVFAALAGQKICVDPGHGGSDPGAVGQGLQEKSTNLDISLRFRDLLTLDAATPIMTRSTDVYVSLQGRCDVANNNGANRFECSHCNAFNGTAKGTETFCHPNETTTGYDLRNKVNPEMVAHMGTVNRGLKTNTFYVLANTNMAAILCEVAFIDNAEDAAKLAQASYRQEAARAYLHGTQSHYGEAPHDPGVADIIIDNTSGSFSVVGAWSTGTSAGKYGTDYRWKSTATSDSPATWTPNITASGSWQVYAWWVQGGNRSNNCAYKVTNTGGTTSVYVNQQAGGGAWNSLGAFNLNTGTGYPVQLSNVATTGFVVVADAIKWHKN